MMVDLGTLKIELKKDIDKIACEDAKGRKTIGFAEREEQSVKEFAPEDFDKGIDYIAANEAAIDFAYMTKNSTILVFLKK